MTMISYLDFDLQIGLAQADGRYPVAVLRSPAGEASELMVFPYTRDQLALRLKDLRIALLSAGRVARLVLPPELQSVQEMGIDFFNALFCGEIRSRYDLSQRMAQEQDQGLRIRLRIQPPELAALPWEYLFDPRSAEYLCLSAASPLVRYLDLPAPIRPVEIDPPLRVLAMVCSPSDLPAIDVAQEKQRMEEALAGLRARGQVELAWLPGQSWGDLQEALLKGPWHVFHFIGHGDFDRRRDEGCLVLCDENGKAQPFHATQLARLLADHRDLRVVVLNACQGARASWTDLYSSTAAVLVRRGIACTLAMQFPITDRAAIELSRRFYSMLARGLPVDQAVGEARKALSCAFENSLEWGTPVLHMRAPDGVLFRLPPTGPGLAVTGLADIESTGLHPSSGLAPAGWRRYAARLLTTALFLCLAVSLIFNLLQNAGVVSGVFGGATPTPTLTQAPPATHTPTRQPSSTSTLAPSQTPTREPTATATRKPTRTPTPQASRTLTPEPSPSATTTPAPSPTLTGTPTPDLSPTATASPTLGIGSSTWWPADGKLMMYVPRGAFGMGAAYSEDDYNRPRHVVYLDAYWIDQTEVTNFQYARCVAAGGCQPPARSSSAIRPAYYNTPRFDNYPVLYVTAEDAAGYCAWAGKRLPTEAEWEKAAQSADNRIFPWGSGEPTCRLANGAGCTGDTSEVGSYPEGASPYGVLDLAGNVREWVSDFFSLDYYQYTPGDNPPGPPSGTHKVVRGGSFLSDSTAMLVSTRDREKPTTTQNDLGFRCAVSANE